MIRLTKTKDSTNKWVKNGIIIVLAAFIIGASSYIGYEYSVVKEWNNKIYPGITTEGLDVSGKTKEEASKLLKEKQSDKILNKKIVIKTSKKSYTLEYSQITPKYNIDQVVNEAFAYGKDLNLFAKYRLIKGRTGKTYNLKFTYNNKPVNNILAAIEKEVNKAPVNAKIQMSNGFVITPDQKGVKLQKDKLQKELISKIDGKTGSDIEINAPIEEVKASVTAESLSSINSKISSFSTEFGSISSQERANNIRLATESINGKVVMPGDTFSFNDTVGQRTAEKGYEAAPVIIGNQVDSGLGGGICQVSTTLYNAVLRANIKPVERSHHTLPSHYVPLGMDATVDYGNLDYKFTNTLKYPIYIASDASGNDVTFTIYSNSSLTATSVDITSEVYQTLQPQTQYQDDSTIPVGQTQVVQNPYTGYKVKVYKNVIQNGNAVSHEVISDDFYKPVNGVIKRGTKKG